MPLRRRSGSEKRLPGRPSIITVRSAAKNSDSDSLTQFMKSRYFVIIRRHIILLELRFVTLRI